MKVVLDTNIILASISKKSPYRLVLDEFRNKTFNLCVSTEILLEYEEKLSDIFSPLVADLFLESLPERSNVESINVYYKWNLVYPDLDDNKFVDCAVAGKVDYLVTNDKDFKPLKKLPFPSLTVLNVEEFITILKKKLE